MTAPAAAETLTAEAGTQPIYLIHPPAWRSRWWREYLAAARPALGELLPGADLADWPEVAHRLPGPMPPSARAERLAAFFCGAVVIPVKDKCGRWTGPVALAEATAFAAAGKPVLAYWGGRLVHWAHVQHEVTDELVAARWPPAGHKVRLELAALCGECLPD